MLHMTINFLRVFGGCSGSSIEKVCYIKDLLFSPNTYLEVDDDASVHYMRNNGTNDAPFWDYVTQTFMQDQMIDMGRGAYPLLVDIDSDGY